MTAAVYRSGTPSLAVPHTQNTAPVLEFNCLYTHDIRRKQKRWQDGFLRFHTFNKRVMVYDIPRNLIGDTHWKAGSELHDGDEVLLESEGVMVQVAESIGRTETDLTELRKSKKESPSEAGSSSPVRAAQTPVLQVLNGHASKPTTQLKHRSLNALLGPPKGPIGKAALPTKSPFEERYAENENAEWNVARPTKRLRLDQAAAGNVTRTSTSTNKPVSKKEPPLWVRTSDSKKQKKAPLEAGQQRLGTKEIIDLCADTDEQDRFLPGFSSDALAPSSSPHKEQLPAKKPAPIRSSSPAFQRQRTPVNAPPRVSVEKPKRADTPLAPERRECAKSAAVDVYVDDEPRQPQNRAKEAQDPPKGHHMQQPAVVIDAQPEAAQSMRPPSRKSGKTLRMMASAPKKKTLLCRDQVSKKPSRVHSANTENAIDALLEVTSQDAVPTKQQPKSQRRQLQKRLARIGRKTAADRGEIFSIDDSGTEIPLPEPTTLSINDARPQTPLNDSALELAQLDQMIMPPERPKSPNPTAIPIVMERQFRRVVSESNNLPSTRAERPPGAPVRFTPSPAKKSPTPIAQAETSNQIAPKKQAPPLPSKPRAKKAIQRSVSLNTTSNGTSTVIISRPFQAPKSPALKAVATEKAADPWSREAFDLLTWRPPGWDEEKWCPKGNVPTAEANA